MLVFMSLIFLKNGMTYDLMANLIFTVLVYEITDIW